MEPHLNRKPMRMRIPSNIKDRTGLLGATREMLACPPSSNSNNPNNAIATIIAVVRIIGLLSALSIILILHQLLIPETGTHVLLILAPAPRAIGPMITPTVAVPVQVSPLAT